uniref:Pentatricopeptide repeat-containing protein n=1 Tax=Ananas comosus var. bracteatus TaxID=296719 RepID=A0A6V7QEV9_ANACO|nr:unnamed protein product [Ananas comosus var. bracteatus]
MLRHPLVACSLPSPSAAPEPISDPRTALSLVSAARDLRQVHSFLIRATERRLSPSTYASLIRALSKSSAPLTAVSLFVDMLRRSPRRAPPISSAPSLRSSSPAPASARPAPELRSIPWPSSSGSLRTPWKLFEEMPVRTVVTWSTMISGYARNGRSKEAMDLFRRMQGEGVEPNANILLHKINKHFSTRQRALSTCQQALSLLLIAEANFLRIVRGPNEDTMQLPCFFRVSQAVKNPLSGLNPHSHQKQSLPTPFLHYSLSSASQSSSKTAKPSCFYRTHRIGSSHSL